MKIAVTGGAGFIASHIVDAYIELGHEVYVIDNLITGKVENINSKAKFIECDITDDVIIDYFFDNKFDILNHHAAQMDVRYSVADPKYDANVNILGSINLFEAAVKSGVKKIIFASSGGTIYGEQVYFPADENHPTMPASPYGISKMTIEHYLKYYHDVHGMPGTVLRYTNVYGPRQNPFGEAGVIAIFSNRMLKNEKAIINGDGKITRDYVFVSDVVNANVLALDKSVQGPYNICTGIEHDVNFIFNKLKKLTGSTISEIHGDAKAGEQFRSVCSYNKIKNELGWEPQIKLDDGLEILINYYKSII